MARQPTWTATWGAAAQPADLDDSSLHVSGQTVRQMVKTSLGGAQLRVRLSNLYGSAPLRIGAAHVAEHAGASSIREGSDRVVHFAGRPDVTIPPGGAATSDPIALSVPALSELAVSLYLPETVVAATEHSVAQETTYVSPPGDFTGAPALPNPTATESWYFLDGVDVERGEGAAIVALGDSITDGVGSLVNANHRWTDFLATRLSSAAPAHPLSVVNEGVSGNRLLTDFIGTSATRRFDRDVLSIPGARYLIVVEGINDLGIPGMIQKPGEVVTAEAMIHGYRVLIDRAHAKGLRVFGGTLLPFEGVTFPRYYSPEGESKRQAVNHWMRTGGAYDSVFDFDLLMRDPAHPTRLLPEYDSGDHIHPNDAGYKAMADAIDLSVFQPGGARASESSPP